jgi:hypothetical protein
MVRYRVTWFAGAGDAARAVETEDTVFRNLDVLVYSYANRHPQIKAKHGEASPDGFIVMDATDKEVFRWIAEPVKQPVASGSELQPSSAGK